MDIMLIKLEQKLLEAAPGRHFNLAFSGGLDSRFLAYAAKMLSFSPLLLHISGPHISSAETASACAWAHTHGFAFKDLPVDPLDLPLVLRGDKKRCYACKRAMFSKLLEFAGRPLCDGTNVSDCASYRPGMQALKELGILSPLALSGFGKQDIQRLAGETGMDDPEQPARPCLLTRLPYGMEPKVSVLRALEKAEDAVRAQLLAGGLAGLLGGDILPALHEIAAARAVRENGRS